MLVKLKRDWFAPGGVLYSKGTVEYNGPEEDLPSDALIVSEKGRLPVRSNTPKAGHGAKPLEEQVLDLIPGASPTHQIEPASEGNPAPELTEDEKAKKSEEAAEVKADEAKAADAEKVKETAEVKKEVAAGVKNAEAAAKEVEKVTDPVFSSTKSK